ncbi:hypothetical protein [Nonomuraea sp. B19D2]|uniref:hypothetical protein n=1 Tax=Nonomuraea sp. B19D2 TaxID=3159561 RepID=UPI0032DB7CDD
MGKWWKNVFLATSATWVICAMVVGSFPCSANSLSAVSTSRCLVWSFFHLAGAYLHLADLGNMDDHCSGLLSRAGWQGWDAAADDRPSCLALSLIAFRV